MGFQHRTIEHHGEFFDHYYLCNYRPRSYGFDGLSESLLHFKSGWRIHKQAWIECFPAELKKIPIKKGTVVLRALHSEDLYVKFTSGNSLDELGLHIEDESRCRYHPWLLRKNKTTQKAKFLSRAGRESEFLGVYMFNPPTEATVNEIIILDDILTTGTCI